MASVALVDRHLHYTGVGYNMEERGIHQYCDDHCIDMEVHLEGDNLYRLIGFYGYSDQALRK